MRSNPTLSCAILLAVAGVFGGSATIAWGQVDLQLTVAESFPFVVVDAVSTAIPSGSAGPVILVGSGGGLLPLEASGSTSQTLATDSTDLPRAITQGYIQDIWSDASQAIAAARRGGVLHYDWAAAPAVATGLTFQNLLYEGWEVWDVGYAEATVSASTYPVLVLAIQDFSDGTPVGRVGLVDLSQALASPSGELEPFATFAVAGPAWSISVPPVTTSSMPVFVGLECGLDGSTPVGVQRLPVTLSISGGGLAATVDPMLVLNWAPAGPLGTHVRDLALDVNRRVLYAAASHRGVYCLDISSGGLSLAAGDWPIQQYALGGSSQLVSYANGVRLGSAVGEDMLVVSLGSPVDKEVQFYGPCAQASPCDLVEPELLEIAGVRVYRLDTNGEPIDSYGSEYKPFGSFTSTETFVKSAGIRPSSDPDLGWVDAAGSIDGFLMLKLDVNGSADSDGVLQMVEETSWDAETPPGYTAPLPLWAHDDILVLTTPVSTSASSTHLYIATEGGVAAFADPNGSTALDDQDPHFEVTGSIHDALILAGFPNFVNGDPTYFPSGRLYANSKGHIHEFDISVPQSPVVVDTYTKEFTAYRGEGLCGVTGSPTLSASGGINRWLYSTHYSVNLADSAIGLGTGWQGALNAYSIGTSRIPSAPAAIGGPFLHVAELGTNDPFDRVRLGLCAARVLESGSVRRHVVYATYGRETELDSIDYKTKSSAGLLALEVESDGLGGYTTTERRAVARQGSTSAHLEADTWQPAVVIVDQTDEILVAAWTCGGVAVFRTSGGTATPEAPELAHVVEIPGQGLFDVALGARTGSLAAQPDDRPIYIGYLDGRVGVLWLEEMLAQTATAPVVLPVRFQAINLDVIGGAVDNGSERLIIAHGKSGTSIVEVVLD